MSRGAADAARWMQQHAHELAAFDLSEPSGVRTMSDLTRTGSEGQEMEFLDWFAPDCGSLNPLDYLLAEEDGEEAQETSILPDYIWEDEDEDEDKDDWSFL